MGTSPDNNKAPADKHAGAARSLTATSPLATTAGVFAAATLCCLLWGSAFPAVKIGYELFAIASDDIASQIAFAGARFLIAGLLVVAGMSIARKTLYVPARSDAGAICLLALFQTIGQYFFFYTGLATASGVASSIINASSYFIAILLAALVFRTERLSSRKLVGCIIGFAGVVLINLDESSSSSGSLSGETLILLASLCSAISTCLTSRLAEKHDPVLITGWQFVFGGLVLLVAGLAAGGRLTPASADSAPGAVAMLIYLALVSAVAYSLWSKLLAENPVSRVSVYGFLTPVFGVVLSALFLGEGSEVNPVLAVAALALVSVGIVIVNREPHANETSQP